MKRIVNIAKNAAEAEKWDIIQQIKMTPQERMAAAKELQIRVYGERTIGLREWVKTK